MAMPLSAPWTIEQLDSLPDDGNRYEVLDGDLFVTPAPSDVHEAIIEWLDRLIIPFVKANGLGSVQHKGVLRVARAHVEPDLIVRPEAPLRGWANAPLPILIVEVLSRSTRHRDVGQKRAFYVGNGVAEYWIVDREEDVVIQIRNEEERRISTVLRWSPLESAGPLEIDVAKMFEDIRARM